MEIIIAGKKISNIKEISSVESMINDFSKVDQAMTEASKACEAFAKFSDTKTIESFGYKATEAVGENIANGAKFVAQKIVQVAKLVAQKIVQFIQWIQSGMLKMKAQALLKQIAANPNLKLSGPLTDNGKLPEIIEAYKGISSIYSENVQGIVNVKLPTSSEYTAIHSLDSYTNFVSTCILKKPINDVKQFLTELSDPNLPIRKELEIQANLMKKAVSEMSAGNEDPEQIKKNKTIVNFSSKYVSFVLKVINAYLSTIAEKIKAQQEAAQQQQQNTQPAPAATQQPTAPVSTNV